jgi:hypothetical protein
MGRDLIAIWRNARANAYTRRILAHPSFADEPPISLSLDGGANNGTVSAGE